MLWKCSIIAFDVNKSSFVTTRQTLQPLVLWSKTKLPEKQWDRNIVAPKKTKITWRKSKLLKYSGFHTHIQVRDCDFSTWILPMVTVHHRNVNMNICFAAQIETSVFGIQKCASGRWKNGIHAETGRFPLDVCQKSLDAVPAKKPKTMPN